MGTTVVACVFHDNKVSIAHVGDSRLYRLRDNLGDLDEQTKAFLAAMADAAAARWREQDQGI